MSIACTILLVLETWLLQCVAQCSVPFSLKRKHGLEIEYDHLNTTSLDSYNYYLQSICYQITIIIKLSVIK